MEFVTTDYFNMYNYCEANINPYPERVNQPSLMENYTAPEEGFWYDNRSLDGWPTFEEVAEELWNELCSVDAEGVITLPCADEDHNEAGQVTSRGTRRVRSRYSKDQVAVLESEFAKDNYLTNLKRYQLAILLKMSEVQVKVWFQNRRMKNKRSIKAKKAKRTVRH